MKINNNTLLHEAQVRVIRKSCLLEIFTRVRKNYVVFVSVPIWDPSLI